jgi:hypothetical protein
VQCSQLDAPNPQSAGRPSLSSYEVVGRRGNAYLNRQFVTLNSTNSAGRKRGPAHPHLPVHYAMLLRVFRVSGWSGPRTRIRSGSNYRPTAARPRS